MDVPIFCVRRGVRGEVGYILSCVSGVSGEVDYILVRRGGRCEVVYIFCCCE